jgi:hypothetical protein
MTDYTAVVMKILTDYWWIFAALGGLGFFIWKFGGFKKRGKVVNRIAIEKRKRIEELSQNDNKLPITIETGLGRQEVDTPYRRLYHGDRFMGQIRNIGRRIIDNPDAKAENKKTSVYELVYNPVWFKKIPNPFKKEIMLLGEAGVVLDWSKERITVSSAVSLDAARGYFYSVPDEKDALNIMNEHLFKHDAEALGDEYFAESQKRSTIDEDKAHAMAIEQIKLQQEQVKRSRAVTG